jgi:hypothetical protein
MEVETLASASKRIYGLYLEFINNDLLRTYIQKIQNHHSTSTKPTWAKNMDSGPFVS